MRVWGYEYMVCDLIGNCGVFLLIASYWGLQAGKLDIKGLSYSVINLCVAILLSINLYFRPNVSSIIIEIFWAGISIYGIYNALKNDVHKKYQN